MSGLGQKVTPSNRQALVRAAPETGHLCARHVSQRRAIGGTRIVVQQLAIGASFCIGQLQADVGRPVL